MVGSELQWNFLPAAGVNAPQAWANLIADQRPGGRGVTVAILDTGVAYRNWRAPRVFARSPDFGRHAHSCAARTTSSAAKHIAYPAVDRNGHGTFVAGTVAEATNNGFGLTGLAYGASIMPVRVLDAAGRRRRGDDRARDPLRRDATARRSSTSASSSTSRRDRRSTSPTIISAIRFAHRHGVVVVAAAGNEGADQLAYPAARRPRRSRSGDDA